MSQHGFISYEELIEKIDKLQQLVDQLEHQHKNDDLAARMLLAEIERMKNAL